MGSGLVSVATIFLLAQHWCGTVVALLVLAGSLAVVLTRAVTWIILQHSKEDGQNHRGLPLLREVYRAKLLVMISLLIASMMLHVVLLSAIFALWTLVILVLLLKLKVSIAGNQEENRDTPSLFVRRVWWIGIIVGCAAATIAIVFIFGIIDARTAARLMIKIVLAAQILTAILCAFEWRL